ncbi:MAG: hypothetical protein FWH23_07310 [Bacteroidales bacterium]|nr:hypothetical protein [Bacteroidales bacterium]
MINLKFIDPIEDNGVAKLTVHKSGKLGISKSAMKLLDITVNRYCKFAYDENNNEKSKVLYMVMEKENDGKAYNISKAGEYYYIKAKNLLNELNIDYTDTKTTIIFDIYPTDYNGTKIYKLNRRIINKSEI